MTDFHRIKRLPPYVFEQVNRIKAAARANGADIIDLGMGNPDLDAPKHVIAKLCETAGRPRTDRYSASKGIAGLRRAQAGYYERRFGVKLNPDTQVVATLGSKEGFANMAQAITAPGDVVLVPNPSYPIHAFGFLMGGVIRCARRADARHVPARERAMQHSIPEAWRSSSATRRNRLCRRARFLQGPRGLREEARCSLLSDLAYAEVYFDGEPPPSVLQVPGAIDCTVEFTSLSKTYSMAGWRMARRGQRAAARGADAGEILPRLRGLHADPGGGHRRHQRAGRLHPRDAGRLQEAPEALVDSFGKAGWKIPAPAASMFAWVPIPERYRSMGSLEFSKLLLEKSDVAVAPGIGFGEHGDDYVRIAMVENEQRIRQAARNLRRFFDAADKSLHNVVPIAQAV